MLMLTITDSLNEYIDYAAQLATISYISVLMFLALSGLFSAAVVWYLIDTVNSVFENGLFMTATNRMLSFLMR